MTYPKYGRPGQADGGRNNNGLFVSIPYERPRPNYMLVDTGPIFPQCCRCAVVSATLRSSLKRQKLGGRCLKLEGAVGFGNVRGKEELAGVLSEKCGLGLATKLGTQEFKMF